MDYQTLKDRVVETLSDPAVTDAKAADFIAQAEQKLTRDLMMPGGVPRQMLVRLTDTTDTDGLLTLPNNYVKAKTVRASDTLMSYVASEHVKNTSGYAEATITLDYYERLPALSDGFTSNWLLDESFDLYLYAACLQYQPFAQDQAYQDWTQFYNDAMASTKLLHAPQPQGGWRSEKRNYPGGVYTVLGNQMYFASKGYAP